MSEAAKTTDHRVIQNWVEAREGRPARVKATGGNGGILRIDFGTPEEDLEEISWDEFFRIFEENDLAFLHQDLTEEGETSRFNKLIDRGGLE